MMSSFLPLVLGDLVVNRVYLQDPTISFTIEYLEEKFTFRTAGRVDVKGISPCMAFFAAFWIDLGTFHSFGWPASCLFHVDI